MFPNPRNKARLALLVAASLLITGAALAKSSDRNQPMTIDAARSEGSFENDGVTHLSGDVVVVQGTLEVHADNGEIHFRNGEIARAVFTGNQARMKQVNDDGTPVDAVADRIDYDVINNIVTLTGNYRITSPKGSNAGQKMVYNTVTGKMQSGGDGTRVHTVIQPKNKAPTSQTPAPARPGAK
ncbi:lipopolysaccharide transport periplasmic protein LptA [Pseudoxanthomonas spadix BD-a59]|uniref:Lipopolysaccharide export system protein LptA n=1 Tax=Pseudoxanthomonas spadix (strain BD-a59) TaxID=1045855 RepID=G7UQP6_PSEUP|nr:lipopolysaccharide transport periplasmic protein LptA [Pseudoxanthomonas spadix]AER55778.1 lipopolysaccharide transport periplasmic protein LptA [Pseudoxanthomonas spadix BD-a59]